MGVVRKGFTKEEHVILQGLGTKWVRLPSGVVDDDVNNAASESEGHLLQMGLMYALRPFYVRSKKESVFVGSNGDRVVLRNDPDEGFKIEIHSDRDLELREGGPGEITVKVPTDEPPTLSVSRALHKMAYLMFCVVRPDAIADPGLQATRDLIAKGDLGSYRPYTEAFVAGAAPGFNFRFLVLEREAGTSVAANIRLHHMDYIVMLAGPLPPTPKGSTRKDTVEPGGHTREEITWRFDSMERRD